MTEEPKARRRLGGRAATSAVIPGDCALSVGNPQTPLPEGWQWQLLVDLARLESGHTPSRKRDDYWGGDIPWIGIRDATANHGRTIYSCNENTNEFGIANSAARVLPKDTVCLSRTASVGYVVVMGRPMATSQDFVNWSCGPTLDYRYLKYALIAEGDALLRFADGSVHQTIYFPEVKALHIAAPSREEQSDIADVLSAIDDKIELNWRMNETLEVLAQAIFKDWFVDFGPVRRKQQGATDPVAILGGLIPDPIRAARTATLFPNSFGDNGLPKGWQRSTLGKHAVNFDSKRVPVSSGERAKRKGTFPYHGATGVMDYVDSYLFDGIYLLVGEDGSVVKESGLAFTQYVWGKIWVNNHAHVLRGAGGVSTEQLLLYFSQEPVEPFITGAVQLKLSQGRMNAMPFVDAGVALNTAFYQLIEPLFARIRASTNESGTLAEVRDYLLPKLMSGEVRVRDAEKMVS